jgi:hypothetical protein
MKYVYIKKYKQNTKHFHDDYNLIMTHSDMKSV